jgi:predicted amidophosphoribosyltransferase
VDLLNLVLPRRCAVCRIPGTDLCGTCLDGLRRLAGPLCARCGAPTAWPVSRCRECSGRRLAFASARAAIAYDDPATRFVGAWKERGLRGLASAAADLMVEVLPPPRGTLTFVPADGDRWLERGHHPAERLAGELSRRWDLPASKLLVRTGRSRRQRGLPLAERRRNVSGAFRATRSVPPSVVLVDDVYTTGSTATAAASALRKGGARDVHVVALARAVRSIR